jgi:AcrR family transcriptional regulator
MTESPLTAERILEASEDVLRRYGPGKATVVDVARELGVSHGSVYRHFPSKAALRDAVAEHWLGEISAPLGEAAAEEGPAPERLRRWLDLLVDSKQSRAREDPELFATYSQLAADAREVIGAHVRTLTDQLARIIADGTAAGDFEVADPKAAAGAVFDATSRFHNPANAAAWTDPGIDQAYEAVRSLVLTGLAGSIRALPKRGS